MSKSVDTRDPELGFAAANNGAPSSSVATAAPLVVIAPRREDLQPSYAATLAATEDASAQGWYPSMVDKVGSVIGFLGAIPFCFCCPNPYKPVTQGNVGLITKFGRFYKAVDPGLVKVNPLSEHLIQVEVKIQIVEVPQQVCMTKDNVTLHLTSVIYYHITSPHKAAFGISNVRQALIERTQTTLRHVIGARVLQDVIERREEITQSISEIMEDVTAGWGVKVESMLIKDLVFSRELQDSLSMAAQAKRIGESKIIAARAEVESAKLMRKAADILNSPAAMQIRYLEAQQQIAKTANSKVIFLPGASQTSGPSQFGHQADNKDAAPSHEIQEDTIDPSFQRALNAQLIENLG